MLLRKLFIIVHLWLYFKARQHQKTNILQWFSTCSKWMWRGSIPFILFPDLIFLLFPTTCPSAGSSPSFFWPNFPGLPYADIFRLRGEGFWDVDDEEGRPFKDPQRDLRVGLWLWGEVSMISSDLGKLILLSFCKHPLPFPASFESSSEVLLDEDLEVTFGAILLRNRNVLKTSLML